MPWMVPGWQGGPFTGQLDFLTFIGVVECMLTLMGLYGTLMGLQDVLPLIAT